MQSKFLSFALVSIISAFIISCAPAGGDNNNTSADKNRMEERKDDRQDEALIRDKDQFQSENYHKIGYNEGRIFEIKKDLNKNDKDYAEQKQKIEDLEEKNRQLKARLDKYDDNESPEKWNEFKAEFKHDMEDLGGALKGFFRDDEKAG